MINVTIFFAYMDPMGIEAVYEAELAKVPREAGFFKQGWTPI